MNTDILSGNWKQIKGNMKSAWGKFTEDEIDQINGDYEKFVGKVQERYGIEKEESRRKVNEFLKDFREKMN